MITRRTFVSTLAGGLLAAPLAAEAQQGATVPKIGYLSPNSRVAGVKGLPVRAFLDGLRELGWIPEHNVRIEYRWAEGHFDRLESLATELVQVKPDVIMANSGPAAAAAKRVTATIPIVFETLGDPVAAGLVMSLSRPSGNATGVAGISAELSGKRLELLRELVPGLTRIGVLVNPGNVMSSSIVRETEAAARALGMSVYIVEIQEPAVVDAAFARITHARVGAVFIVPDVMLYEQHKRILALTARHRLPAVYVESEWVPEGGLMSYAPNLATQYRRAAVFVDKILKGAKPADLPVEQPTQFELIINLKTAKALGLKIPQSVLRRADQVIQ
jgi:putative ABC transport system substrate-binding protein